MSTALFRFELRLLSTSEAGVVFVDWRPQGRGDAISLPMLKDTATLLLWFESWEGYSLENREIESGSLYGEVQLRDLSGDDIAMLKQAHQQMEEDTALGKRYRAIVKMVVRIAHHGTARLLERLTVNYGQYWLLPADFYRWDSRHRSLAHYAYFDLKLERSVDGGTNWIDFRPEIEELRPRFGSPEASDGLEPDRSLYINRTDWDAIALQLGKSTTDDERSEELKLVTSMFTELRREFDAGYFGYALILASTALELALNHYIRLKCESSPALMTALQPVRELRLPSKYSAIAMQLPLSMSDIELTLDAIRLRNEIVHEGREAREESGVALEAVIRSIITLLPSDVYRLPPHPDVFWS